MNQVTVQRWLMNAGCAGARHGVDEFFANTHTVPLVLPTGQAIVVRSRSRGAGMD